jgi:hypothetical protein
MFLLDEYIYLVMLYLMKKSFLSQHCMTMPVQGCGMKSHSFLNISLAHIMGGVDSIDQYYANNSNGVASDVIHVQDESGDEQEESEENPDANGAPGAAYRRSTIQPLQDKSGAKYRVDTPGVAAEDDPIIIGSGTAPTSDVGTPALGSLGIARLTGACGRSGQGKPASMLEAGSSAGGGSAAAPSGFSAPASSAPSVALEPRHHVLKKVTKWNF